MPEPSSTAFHDRFEEYITRCPMELEDITSQDLRLALARMGNAQAAGMEEWRIVEIKSLPQFLLTRLVAFYNAVEEWGRWPASLERAAVTLIPKDGSDQPGDLRPISVMSVVYRLWALARLRSVMLWKEQWISEAQHWAKAKHGTEDVFWALALEIEHAILSGEPLYGVCLDYKKCFDSLPQTVLLKLSERLGLHERVLGRL